MFLISELKLYCFIFKAILIVYYLGSSPRLHNGTGCFMIKAPLPSLAFDPWKTHEGPRKAKALWSPERHKNVVIKNKPNMNFWGQKKSFKISLSYTRNSQRRCQTWRDIWENRMFTPRLINARLAWKWPCALFSKRGLLSFSSIIHPNCCKGFSHSVAFPPLSFCYFFPILLLGSTSLFFCTFFHLRTFSESSTLIFSFFTFPLQSLEDTGHFLLLILKTSHFSFPPSISTDEEFDWSWAFSCSLGLLLSFFQPFLFPFLEIVVKLCFFQLFDFSL